MYYVGIDVAKHTHTAAIKLDDGTSKGDVLEFSNDAKGFDSLLNFFEEFGVSPDESLIVMESTGHYWKVLYSYLLGNNFSVAVENPLRIDAYRNAGSIRKTKTDAIDAVLIADFARVKTPNPTSLAPKSHGKSKRIKSLSYKTCQKTHRNKKRGYSNMRQPFSRACRCCRHH